MTLDFSLSMLGKGAEQVAHWLPKSFVGILFPMAGRLVDYNNQCGAASKELDQAAFLREKVLLRGDVYEIKSWLRDSDPAQVYRR